MMSQEDLVKSLEGRTIMMATWYGSDSEWPEGEEVAVLLLDDGRLIEFGAYGYDAWGATIREVDPNDSHRG